MRFNRKSVKVTASNDSAAISTNDIKEFLRIDGLGDDAILASYVKSATEALKQYLRVALLTETFEFKADGFRFPDADERLVSLGPGIHNTSYNYVTGGSDTLDIPFAPIQSITSITTYDRANASTEFASSKYNLDKESGRIFLNEGETWPTSLRSQNAVEVVYVAGYGSGSIPDPVLQAIRLYVAQMYDGCAGMTEEIMRLVSPYKRFDELAW